LSGAGAGAEDQRFHIGMRHGPSELILLGILTGNIEKNPAQVGGALVLGS
jgi:hypothetical protein